MKLYMWRSEAMKEYREGYIVAMAEDPDQARAKAIVAYTIHLQHSMSWMFDSSGRVDDEDDKSIVANKITQFMNDLKRDPKVIGAGAMVIPGGE